MYLSVFVLGASSLIAQTAFLREIIANFRGGELIIGIALLGWMVWTAVGSGLLGRISGSISDPAQLFHTLFSIYGFLGYLGIAAIPIIPRLSGLVPGESVPYGLQVLTAILVLLPFNMLGGFLFTLGATSLGSIEQSSGRAYMVESFGSATAGIIASCALVMFLSNNTLAIVPVALTTTVSAWWFITHHNYRRAALLFAAFILCTLGIVYLVHLKKNVYDDQAVLVERDTRYGRIRVMEQGNARSIHYDAALLFSGRNDEANEYTAHLPMLASPGAERVLVLGGGYGGVIDEVLKYRSVKKICTVELDPALLQISEAWFDESWQSNPRTEAVTADGRAFLEQTDEVFDVIIMTIPPPLTGTSNRYYTGEFFALASSRLAEDGILGFSVIGADNYLPEETARYLASIRRTLSEAFPSVAVLPGLRTQFIAAKQHGRVDALSWETLESSRKTHGIETRYVRDYFLRYILSPERIASFNTTLDHIETVPTNSDTRPTGILLRTIVQGTIDRSALIAGLAHVSKAGRIYMLLLLILIGVILMGILSGRRRQRFGIVNTVTTVGMTEISLEIMAILAFQSVFGFLYGKIALLTGTYMAGLTLGSYRGLRSSKQTQTGVKQLAQVQSLIALVAIAWIVIFGLHTMFPGRIPLLEPLFYLLTLAAGYTGGYQFPLADALYGTASDIPMHHYGTIYAADLAGSAVGALVTTTIMIPVLGMIPVLAFLAIINAIGAMLLLRQS